MPPVAATTHLVCTPWRDVQTGSPDLPVVDRKHRLPQGGRVTRHFRCVTVVEKLPLWIGDDVLSSRLTLQPSLGRGVWPLSTLETRINDMAWLHFTLRAPLVSFVYVLYHHMYATTQRTKVVPVTPPATRAAQAASALGALTFPGGVNHSTSSRRVDDPDMSSARCVTLQPGDVVKLPTHFFGSGTMRCKESVDCSIVQTPPVIDIWDQ